MTITKTTKTSKTKSTKPTSLTAEQILRAKELAYAFESLGKRLSCAIHASDLSGELSAVNELHRMLSVLSVTANNFNE